MKLRPITLELLAPGMDEGMVNVVKPNQELDGTGRTETGPPIPKDSLGAQSKCHFKRVDLRTRPARILRTPE
jgi:hypothetical protein